MPIIELKTNLKNEEIASDFEARFNRHFAPIWGKDPSVSQT